MENELRKSILNWYPFAKNTKILCIGEKSLFFEKELQFYNIEILSEKNCGDAEADYIIVYGELERCDNPIMSLELWKQKLKPNGHLLLAVENRLGLRYFVGDRDPFTNRAFDGIEGYRNFSDKDMTYLNGRNYAKFELEEMLSQAGFNYKFYSIIPGLEMPQQIYAEDYLPIEEMEIRYTPLYHNPDTVFLEEAKVFKSLIANGMFHQMANAYLIDCSVGEVNCEIDFLTTSMDRGEEKATATILYKNGTVEKKALYPEGKNTIDTLVNNTNTLQARGISVVPISVKGEGSCEMPYIKAETALTYLRRLVYKDKDKFIEAVDYFISLIYKSSDICLDKNEDELGKYYQNVYIDMVPLNCFWLNNGFVFYDQEYVEHNYPINVVIVRTIDILYMGDKSMEAIVPSMDLLRRYGIDKKVSALRDMGDKFIRNLRNEDKLSKFNNDHRATAIGINTNRQRISYTPKEHKELFHNFLPQNEEELYLFGAGLWARKFIAEYKDKCEISGALDNNPDIWGKVVDGVEIMDPSILENKNPQSYKVVICIKYYASVVLQLKYYGAEKYSIYDPYLEDETGNGNFPVVLNPIESAVAKTEEGVAEGLKKKPYHIGYNAGVFDLFHIGHLNILRRAKEQCDYLVVGVVSDEQAAKSKNKSPYVSEQERLEIVKACRYVDEAFILPPAASGTRDVYKKYHFDVQFSGSDYEHDPNWLQEQKWLRDRGSDLVFFPYTQSTSSTKLKEAIERKEK